MDQGLTLSENIIRIPTVETTMGIILVVFLIFYLVFSILVVRQVQLLNKILGTTHSGALRAISMANLIFSIILLVISILTVFLR